MASVGISVACMATDTMEKSATLAGMVHMAIKTQVFKFPSFRLFVNKQKHFAKYGDIAAEAA